VESVVLPFPCEPKRLYLVLVYIIVSPSLAEVRTLALVVVLFLGRLLLESPFPPLLLVLVLRVIERVVLEAIRVLRSRSFLPSTYSAEGIVKLGDLATGLGESFPEVVDLLLEKDRARSGVFVGVVIRFLPPELVLGYRETLCPCYILDRG
jgi:hypothetical protein